MSAGVDRGSYHEAPAEVDDDSTLKEIALQACKKFDIGAAALPKLLFCPDVDEMNEYEQVNGNDNVAYPGPSSAATSRSTTPTLPISLAGSSTYETRYAKVLKKEFSAVVVEHHLKWAPLCVAEPGPLPNEFPSERLGRYDFHHADAVVDWAVENGMKVKGHVLTWSVTSPQNLLEKLEPYQIREHLRRHIYTTIGHYRGRIHVWDVVNEALAPDGSFAQNIFYRKLGPTYIEEAFRWAHDADPKAILLYNDNKVEGMGGPNAKKSDAFYNLLSDLKAKDVPIHGCGIQAHFNAAGVGRNRVPTPRMVKQQIRRIGELGLSVNISEMDVRVSQLSPNIRQIAQRQIYHDILAAALSEPAFDGIWLWGFTDRHTWVTHFYYDDEPLIFDEEYERKEAYYGLRDALATLAPGGVVGGRKVPLNSDYDDDGNKWGHSWMQPEPEIDSEKSNDDANTISESGDDDSVEGDERPDWLQPSSDAVLS